MGIKRDDYMDNDIHKSTDTSKGMSSEEIKAALQGIVLSEDLNVSNMEYDAPLNTNAKTSSHDLLRLLLNINASLTNVDSKLSTIRIILIWFAVLSGVTIFTSLIAVFFLLS